MRRFGHGAGRSTHGEAPHLERATVPGRCREPEALRGHVSGLCRHLQESSPHAKWIAKYGALTRQPSKEVRGEAVLAAVVSSAAGRVSAQCRSAPEFRRGRLQRCLLSLVTSPRRVASCLVLLSSQDVSPVPDNAHTCAGRWPVHVPQLMLGLPLAV